MNKLRITIKPEPPVTWKYVSYMRTLRVMYGHDNITLPPESAVAMTERIMLEVQRRVQPHVSWARDDHDYWHHITMRWLRAEMSLDAQVNARGVYIHLYPELEQAEEHTMPALAAWGVNRTNDPIRAGEHGYVDVIRLERAGGSQKVTSLSFEDPVLDGMPRCRPIGKQPASSLPAKLPELIDDIVTVTQGYLTAALAA